MDTAERIIAVSRFFSKSLLHDMAAAGFRWGQKTKKGGYNIKIASARRGWCRRPEPCCLCFIVVLAQLFAIRHFVRPLSSPLYVSACRGKVILWASCPGTARIATTRKQDTGLDHSLCVPCCLLSKNKPNLV